ncbi:MAG: hypothetical protein ABEJ03_01065 [Candidatus Nanohaloarchaea archaeon]
MTRAETVSVSEKGRPLKRALGAERKNLDLSEEESVRLGISAFLSNGPGKELDREDKIEDSEERLRKEIEAARMAGIDLPDPQDKDAEQLYREVTAQLESVTDFQEDDPRAYFDSITVGETRISGRNDRELFEGDYDRIYANSDQIPECLNGADSLQEAAFQAAEEEGYLPTGEVEGSEVSWAILSDGEEDVDRVLVPDNMMNTVGNLIQGEGYAVHSLERVVENSIYVDQVEDEEDVASLIDGPAIRRWESTISTHYQQVSRRDSVGVCYIVDTGTTAREKGLNIKEAYSSSLLKLEPVENEGVRDRYEDFRTRVKTRGVFSLNPEAEEY